LSDSDYSKDEGYRSRSASRRERMMTRLFRRSSGESEAAFDRRFWAAAGPDAIWSAAWEMTLEVLRFRGESVGQQPRLQRSVERIFRRGS